MESSNAVESPMNSTTERLFRKINENGTEEVNGHLITAQNYKLAKSILDQILSGTNSATFREGQVCSCSDVQSL